MPEYPNNKPWAVDLVGFYEKGDWFGTGNVVLWDDGTVWVYAGESPVHGDQATFYYPSGISIHERKPGSDFWERLTPDTWGDPWYAPPPGYPNWFGLWPSSGAPIQFDSGRNVEETPRSAPLNVARFIDALEDEPQVFALPPNGDEVIFMTYGTGQNANAPLVLNKATRQWRVMWNEDPIIGLNTRIWWNAARASNVVVYDGYYWFLAYQWVPNPNLGTYDIPIGADIDRNAALQLVRAPVSNTEDIRVIHQFSYVDGWLENHITTDITDIPGFFNNSYLHRGAAPYDLQILMGDGMFYVFNEDLVHDPRTTTTSWSVPGAVNYDMKVSYLRQTAIGDWDNLKVVYYHSNQGWVGYSRPVTTGGGSTTGTMNFGSIGSFQDSEGYGSGFNPVQSWSYPFEYYNGFIYFWLFTGIGGNNVGGSPCILCRMDVSGLDPESPRAYERDNPYYEVIGNGTGDWEGSFGKKYWGYGHTLFMRYGSQAIYPYPDYSTGLRFDDEGGIWFTGFQYLFESPYGPIAFNQGYPTKVLLRLRPPDNETRVTLTFTGTAYQGYTAVRETGSRTREIELELGSVQPV